jgi:hypothetical protein
MVEQAETQLRVVVPIEEEEEETISVQNLSQQLINSRRSRTLRIVFLPLEMLMTSHLIT